MTVRIKGIEIEIDGTADVTVEDNKVIVKPYAPWPQPWVDPDPPSWDFWNVPTGPCQPGITWTGLNTAHPKIY